MKKRTNKKAKYNILHKELLHLEQVKRSELDKIKMARLDGDVSENGDLTALEKKTETLQNQIYLLKGKIWKMEKSMEQKEKVTYKLVENGKEKSVELVGDWEVDPFLGKISYTSPLGRVLKNKKIGEIGEVQTNQKRYKIKIIKKTK